MKTPDRLIWNIQDSLGLKEYQDEHCVGGFRYDGVMCTGEFSTLIMGYHMISKPRHDYEHIRPTLGDYGAGILLVSVRLHNSNAVHSGIAISTIDDGVWQSEGDLTAAKVHVIAKSIQDTYGTVLPSELEFVEFIKQFGLTGQFSH